MKQFKFLSLLLFAALSFAVCACSSSDDDAGLYLENSDVVGTWVCEDATGTINLYFYEDGEGYYEEIGNNYSNPETLYFKWQISSGHLYVDIFEIEDYETKITKNGSKLTLNLFGMIFEKESNHSSNGDLGSGTEGGDADSKDIATLIKNNVECRASYYDYHTHITVNHTLKSKLPNSTITLKICHAQRGSSICTFITYDRNPITPSTKYNGSNTEITIAYPFYYYFLLMYGQSSNWYDEEHYKNICTKCEMYMASYNALTAKSNLTSEENELLNELKKELNKHEKEAKGDYTVWIYLNINGKDYLLKSYNV